MTQTHTQMRKLIGATALAASAVTAVACKASDIDITNPNSAIASAVASDPTALQLLATGLLVDQRGTRQALIMSCLTLSSKPYDSVSEILLLQVS